jgi:predicted  nucleic acid-binding Zn-ribbon protein
MTEREHLIALQEIDTAIDQLRNRIDRLPERLVLDEATAALTVLRRARDTADQERVEAEDAMTRIEADSAEIDAHRTRLQAQMKTIISPREAEALQKEMDVLAARRDELDDRGLEFLEMIGAAEERSAAATGAEPEAQAAVDAAAGALAAVVGDLQAQIAVLTAQRESTVAETPAGTVSRYESMRRTHGGLAVARLVGPQCTGCHLELSRAEAETVRHVPADELPDCPSCGRVLLP